MPRETLGIPSEISLTTAGPEGLAVAWNLCPSEAQSPVQPLRPAFCSVLPESPLFLEPVCRERAREGFCAGLRVNFLGEGTLWQMGEDSPRELREQVVGPGSLRLCTFGFEIPGPEGLQG